jgi:hypothetical protein
MEKKTWSIIVQEMLVSAISAWILCTLFSKHFTFPLFSTLLFPSRFQSFKALFISQPGGGFYHLPAYFNFFLTYLFLLLYEICPFYFYFWMKIVLLFLLFSTVQEVLVSAISAWILCTLFSTLYFYSFHFHPWFYFCLLISTSLLTFLLCPSYFYLTFSRAMYTFCLHDFIFAYLFLLHYWHFYYVLLIST